MFTVLLPLGVHPIAVNKYIILCIIAKYVQRVRRQVSQDRQRTYNVTLRPVRATIVVVEKQLVLHVVSVCL
jgi:hypothetical protein